MRIPILYALPLLFFACNSGKEEAAKQHYNDSIHALDSAKANTNCATPAVPKKDPKADSIKSARLGFWKKQATLISVSLEADQDELGHAQQLHFGRMPAKRKRQIQEATKVLLKDKARSLQIKDSLRKYQG